MLLSLSSVFCLANFKAPSNLLIISNRSSLKLSSAPDLIKGSSDLLSTFFKSTLDTNSFKFSKGFLDLS